MKRSNDKQYERDQIAKDIRDACIKAAREGFREASMSGLCSEGAIEAAVGAIQSLDLEKVINARINS